MKIRLFVDEVELQVSVQNAMKNSYVFDISGQKYDGNIDHWGNNRLVFSIKGHDHTAFISEDRDSGAYVSLQGIIFRFRRTDLLTENTPAAGQDAGGPSGGHITSPMPGKVIKINVSAGDKVKKGQVLLIIEAMKMENLIAAPAEGVVQKINVGLNQMVETSMPLLDLTRT
jgi:acetyl/propionyl-CoA carboxylase alpha subunit